MSAKTPPVVRLQLHEDADGLLTVSEPSPAAPDSLVARLRTLRTKFGGTWPEFAEAADHIEQLQRERDNAFRAAREHAQASLDSVNRAEAAESRLARITQALVELVACKDLKDRGWHMRRNGTPEADILAVEREYAERKQKAWQAARDAIRHTTEG